jgi:hypothetical protein
MGKRARLPTDRPKSPSIVIASAAPDASLDVSAPRSPQRRRRTPFLFLSAVSRDHLPSGFNNEVLAKSTVRFLPGKTPVDAPVLRHFGPVFGSHIQHLLGLFPGFRPARTLEALLFCPILALCRRPPDLR